MGKALRKYEDAWNKLKEYKQIKAEVTKSNHKLVVKKFASTFVRGIQNEKYIDYEFRRSHPNAVVSSDIDYTSGTITLTLNLNDFQGLESI